MGGSLDALAEGLGQRFREQFGDALIGAVLMLVLFEPELDEGLLRIKIAELAMAVLSGGS